MIAYVLTINEKKMSSLYSAETLPLFSYPRRSDILWVSVAQIVYIINPITAKEKIYKQSKIKFYKINKTFFCFTGLVETRLEISLPPNKRNSQEL